ncbi:MULTISPECIES: transglycosylase SLT domain-containing protein [unclassified Streptomyces]|uniref:transglycosylase SLT domain-containing protein n=1 Tax=unclassified Streptomyces TaxID=2593676 RepID=UPI0023EACE8B|nr:transglycosylase SLT domain-containing protein [Streptomyces sp. WMMB303]MDF4250146.1 transglycosylase SLT domain-containing protein [Streptomyces sp. WMMB303]
MPSISSLSLSPKAKKISTIGIGTAGAAALALTVLPGTAHHGDAGQATAKKVQADSVAFSSDSSVLPAQGKDLTAQQQSMAPAPADTEQVASVKNAATTAKSFTSTDEAAAAIKADAEKRAAKAAAEKKAEAAAAKERAAKAAADRSKRAAAPSYPDNLDGWIREARAIMAKHGIPGSYEGIKRNIIRESAGDPRAINNWDINAQNGVPSKGLLQVIKPTFDAYHVEGTAWDQYDPVANIVAACNYAADRYGSMDNVNSAY